VRMTSAALFSLLLAAAPAWADHVQLVSRIAPDAGGTSATPPGGVTCSSFLQVSADGRYAVYQSTSTAIVAGQTDTNGREDVFLFDRVAETTTLVSHNATSPTATGDDLSFDAVLSADGRWIAYQSFADDLVSGFVSAGGSNLYLYDRSAGTTTLVSHTPSSPTASACTSRCGTPALSGDGRFVTYVRDNAVVLYDREAATDVLVSHTTASPATPSAGHAMAPVVNGDGSAVAYYSDATDLVAGQTDANAKLDVFLWDRATGTNVLVSHAASSSTQAGNTGASYSWPLQISSDGRWVAYNHPASDLVAGISDTNAKDDVFLWDRATGINTLISRSAVFQSHTGNEVSELPRLTPDGRWLTFGSRATDLVAGVTDANHDFDAFLFDRIAGTVTLLSPRNGTPGATANGWTGPYAISDDGVTIALESVASDLAPGVTDLNSSKVETFLLNRATGEIVLASRTPSSATATGNGSSECTTLSPNGQVVLFQSRASNLVAADENAAMDAFAFVRDPLDYFTLTPCRLFDSRQSGPALASGVNRKIAARGACGISAAAQALTVNVTVTGPTGEGYLTAYPGAGVFPESSTINFTAGTTRANNAVVLLNADGTLALYPFVNGPGTVHVIVDVTGYFQ